MIFALYRKVRVKLGDESYDFDRSSLMFPEVIQIENATGLSFGEWQSELGRYSIRAVAGLLHVLRHRAGVHSDFDTLTFAVEDLECIPLHDDGTEYTQAEVTTDVTGRMLAARGNPTGNGAGSPATEASPTSATTPGTSPGSPSTTESAPGSGGS